MNVVPAVLALATWRKARNGSNESSGLRMIALEDSLTPAAALHRLPWPSSIYFYAEWRATHFQRATNQTRDTPIYSMVPASVGSVVLRRITIILMLRSSLGHRLASKLIGLLRCPQLGE